MCIDKRMGLSERNPEQANDLITAVLSLVYDTILFQLIARSYVYFALHRKLKGVDESDES